MGSRKSKQVTAFILAAALSVVLVVAAPAGAVEAAYQDGTYVAVSDATQHGYLMAIVTIKDGQDRPGALDGDERFWRSQAGDLSVGAVSRSDESAARAFVEANSWDVDIVAQATGTSESARTAVRRALEKASGTATGKYFDGTFFGRSPADEHGYGTALVTIENDRIVAVTLNEVLPDGTWKDFETYPWEPTVKGRASWRRPSSPSRASRST